MIMLLSMVLIIVVLPNVALHLFFKGKTNKAEKEFQERRARINAEHALDMAEIKAAEEERRREMMAWRERRKL